jgi:hypothetical protein
MMHQSLKVAVPWSLSHYIPLNGFHPLYRALFDHAPDTVNLIAWDNVSLYRRFRSDASIRDTVVMMAKEQAQRSDCLVRNSVEARYQEYFWPPNQVLTTELLGDVEFHHTALFPSLQRPFVFHCESFAPVLFPFAQQGSGDVEQHREIREHYRSMLANPLCLGVWSHVPETLKSLSLFFSDLTIDRKLFQSRIGLSASSLPDVNLPEKPPLSRPRFLFMNSAHQNPADFFRRGGHIVLRFWQGFLAEGREGLLMLRCARPSDEDLIEHGVDVSMVRAETGRSIIWVQDYLANHEMNALMASTHFFLLPSASLHSVSIMQAMMLGTIPVVTDTVGTSVYVTDNETGIMLHGMRAALWYTDAGTGILVDRYCRTPDLDDSLVSQLTSRILALLDAPDAHEGMRSRTIAYAQAQFSGQAFSDHFWGAVFGLYQRYKESSTERAAVPSHVGRALLDCTIKGDGWVRVFESPTQPMLRINTGLGVVWELGGAMIHAHGNPHIAGNDWSILAQHYRPGALHTTFANTLEELGGKYLPVLMGHGEEANSKFVRLGRIISGFLKPFPTVHHYASCVFRKFRHYAGYRSAKPKTDPDIELVRHGVSGYNIIRHSDRYYAILRSEAEFIPEKAEMDGYSSSFSDHSLNQVMCYIAASTPSSMQFSFREDGLGQIEVVLEGYYGFNIIRQGSEFHAILQSEWSLVRDQFPLKQDSCFFSGFSLGAVQRTIVAFLEDERGPANSYPQSAAKVSKS